MSIDGRTHLLRSLCHSTHLAGCVGWTPEGICILKSPVVRAAACDGGDLVVSHEQLHGKLGKYLKTWAGGPEGCCGLWRSWTWTDVFVSWQVTASAALGPGGALLVQPVTQMA